MHRKVNQITGIKLPVTCPECNKQCGYISVGKQANVDVSDFSKYVAYYGCRDCYIVVVVNCSQTWGAQKWDKQLAEWEKLEYAVNPIEDWFNQT